MELEKHKAICSECNFKMKDYEKELLKAKNPFDESEYIYGCPNCKSINCFSVVCDEPGCWGSWAAGTPTDKGYRSVCSNHYQTLKS